MGAAVGHNFDALMRRTSIQLKHSTSPRTFSSDGSFTAPYSEPGIISIAAETQT